MYLRVGSKGVARRDLIALLLCTAVAGGGCGSSDDVRVALVVDPVSPSVGSDSEVRVTLHDERARPIRGARLRVEAHMSHPGMAPVVAEAKESTDGTYSARIPFSMAGEWTLVATGALADGRRIAAHVERTDVRAKP